MLAHVLALVVGLGSFALYMAAFFFPEVHRRNDFIWSGVGLFYALVLWFCAGRITGGVLLGQTASVALLGWLGWQTLTLRRQITPLSQQTAIPSSDEVKSTLADLSKPENLSKLSGQVGEQFGKLKSKAQSAIATASKPKQPKPEATEQPYVPLTPTDFANARRDRLATESQTAIAAPQESVSPASTADPWDVEAESTPVEEVAVAKPAVSKPSKVPTAKSSTSIAELPAKVINRLPSVLNQIKSLLPGQTKRESKPTYVRKQFRTPETETPETETPETETPETETPSSDTQISTVVTESISPEPIAPESTALESTARESIAFESATPESATPESTPPELATPESTAPASIASDPVLQADAIATDEVLGDNEAAVLSPPDPEGEFIDDSALPSDALVEAEIEFEAHQPSLEETPELEGDSESETEPTLKAVPPRPPSPELINAAIVDAEEKQLSASPPVLPNHDAVASDTVTNDPISDTHEPRIDD